MPIASVGTMGTGVSSVSSTTFTLTTATNALASGNFAILTVVSDNTSTADGNTNDHTGVSGGTGTWTKLGEYTNTVGGVAADGVTTSLWLFEATGTVAIGTVITVTLGTARIDKVSSMWKFTKAVGTNIRLDPDAATNPVNNGTDAANGFGSVAFSGLPSQSRLYFRGLGKEANTTTAITNSTSFTAITGNRSRNNASAVTLRGEFRINTSTGETSNPTLAVVGDTANVFVALEEWTPPAAQPLTQNTRFDNSNTFNAHTLTVGPVTLPQATRFDNGQTFYAATLTATGGPQGLTAGLYTNDNTFYAHSVTSSYAVTAARYDNAHTFYAATVSTTYSITADRYDNTNTFYGPTVSADGANLFPPFYINDNSFYNATVNSVYPISADRFDNANAFYSLNVVQHITFQDWVESGWVESGWVEWPYFNPNQFFEATVGRGTINLSPQLTTNTSEFYTAVIEQSASDLFPSLFTNNNAFYNANVANQYPDPRYVLKGIVYGNGLVGEYTDSIKLELTTGQLVKPLNSKVAIFL